MVKTRFGSMLIPSNPSTCAAAGYSITCDFATYGSAGILNDQQKLSPNLTVTGSRMFKAFVATVFSSLILSLILLIERIIYERTRHSHNPNSKAEHRAARRTIHMIESLLHTLGDQQIASGLALIAAFYPQGCSISAYHFQLASTMLIMSIVTQLTTLISIPDFIQKGRSVGLTRIGIILAQMVLSGIIFSARRSPQFPAKAGSLAIMPVACFMNMNATDGLGFGDAFDLAHNITTTNATAAASNATQIWNNVTTAANNTSTVEYFIFVILAILTLIVLVVDAIDGWVNPELHSASPFWRRVGLGLSGLGFFGCIFVAFYALNRYNTLRNGMEIPELYKKSDDGPPSLSQTLPLFLLGTGLFTVIKSATEPLLGLKGRRYTRLAKQVGYQGIQMQRDYKQAQSYVSGYGPYDSNEV